MAIKIKRNDAGNCIEFQGSSNPVYWNACLSGEVDSTDNTLVNIINDIKTAQAGSDKYEFFRIPYTEFLDEDGLVFADAQEVADYVTLKGNVAASEDINVGYKGVFDASTNADPTDASPVNGDWYYVGTEGTINTIEYKVNDIIKYSETTTSWERIENKNATVQELEDSALDQYDIHVDGGYTGTIRNGSSIYPYNDLSVAIAASNEGDTILIKGDIEVPNSSSDAFVLPHGLHFYGADESEIKFTTYDSLNGDLFYFEGTDNSQNFSFKNLVLKNAGGYALHIKKTSKVVVEDCTLENNGWNGLALNTVASNAVSGLLGYDSTNTDLQAFYAGVNASNGGATRIEEATQLLIIGNTVTKNLRGIRVSDCGINGGGVISRNQSTQNIESGIYLSVGSLGGCQNVTVTMNVSSYNANNGLLVIGGINNKFSQNEVNGNWNAGFCAWGSANTTLRDCGLYDNNRSQYNGIGNTGDAKASIQINEAYNLLGTQITLNPAFRFIAEILDTQVHYTGLGSNTEKIGFLITNAVGLLADNAKNIIKVDDVGFIGQDYAIDLTEVDVSNLRLSFGDNSYQSIGIKAIKPPLQGNYSELPFSNHVMEVPEVDVVVDTLKQTIALHEGVGGNVINVYSINELQSVLKNNSIDIIQKASDKIQLRDLTLGNVYINGVVAGSNVNTMNDSLNAAFNMDLVEYKEFIETEVGVEGDGDSATFYYIESPDGTYHYPLFKTEAEANQVDTDLSGSGTSHTHTYADDLTNTTWYMPDVSNHMSSNVMPVNGLYTAPNGESIPNVIWNIQTTDDDANYLPTFSNITYSVQEGSAINIQYKAAGMTDTFNVTNIPAGYADNGFAIVGTAEDISNGYGQAIQHVLNVTKANAFGSVQGTITINVLADLAGNEFTIVDQGGVIKFTQDGGATTLDFNTVTFNAGSTYKFYVDGATMDTNDIFDIVDVNGNSVTGGDGLSMTGGSGVGYAGTYFQYVIPTDVEPGKSLKFTDGDTNVVTTVPMTIAGSSYSVSITGITLEGGTGTQTGSVILEQNGYGKHTWISLNEKLGAGQRLVLSNGFFTDLLSYMQVNDNTDYRTFQVAIGLKGDNWNNTLKTTPNAASSGIFKGDAFLNVSISVPYQTYYRAWANGVSSSQFYTNTIIGHNKMCAFLEISPDGNSIRLALGQTGSYNVNLGDEATTLYSDWTAYKNETGDQGYGITELDVAILIYNSFSGTREFDADEIDWTALTEVSVPTAPTANATSWTKAVDFDGSNDFLKQGPTSSFARIPMMLPTDRQINADSILTEGYTSSNGQARTWAATVTFKWNGGSSDQYIWSMGGSQSQDIHLYVNSGGDIYFAWGAAAPKAAEKFIANVAIGEWISVYVGCAGLRPFPNTDANETNLNKNFDIRVANANFIANDLDASQLITPPVAWAGTGSPIMYVEIDGSFTVGASHNGNRFYGTIASMVTTTLKLNEQMPTNAEIKMMMLDPMGWLNDYKIGNSYRPAYTGSNVSNFQLNDNSSYTGTQVWLMGDGTNDSFSNGIRNQVESTETTYTKLVFNNMQSDDVQNVTISGLS